MPRLLASLAAPGLAAAAVGRPTRDDPPLETADTALAGVPGLGGEVAAAAAPPFPPVTTRDTAPGGASPRQVPGPATGEALGAGCALGGPAWPAPGKTELPPPAAGPPGPPT